MTIEASRKGEDICEVTTMLLATSRTLIAPRDPPLTRFPPLPHLRLPSVGAPRPLQNLLHVVREAHVEHLVRLVQNCDVDLRQVEVAPVEVVDAPTGGGDYDVDAGLEGPGLRVVGDAAVEEGNVEVQLRRRGKRPML